MMKNALLVPLALLSMAGCTSKSLYQTGQNYQKTQCIKEAKTSEEYNTCLSEEKKSFEEYQRQREELAKSTQAERQ